MGTLPSSRKSHRATKEVIHTLPHFIYNHFIIHIIKGLYGNPYYQKKNQQVKEEEKELESRFFIKQKDTKENKNKSKFKKKKMNADKQNTFQLGESNVKVVIA